MAKKVGLSTETNFFGTTVTMATADGKFSLVVASNLPKNPFTNKVDKISGNGFLYRNPESTVEDWQGAFESLADLDGKFVVQAEVDKNNKITGYIRIENEEDSAAFGWANIHSWQKWSNEQTKEEKAAAKEKTKVFEDENGNLKATVTVTSLTAP